MTGSTTSTPLTVRVATADEHLAFLKTQSSASFLQTPAWGRVKAEWRHESLLWEVNGRAVGAALVLYRQLPKVRRYLAYLPEGPVIDYTDDNLADWLNPLVKHLKKSGAFGVRIGPAVVTRRWDADSIKSGIADEAIGRLGDLTPSERTQVGARVVSQLHELGWRPQSVEGGFAAGQPQFNFMVPLRHADGTQKSEDDVLKAMNQLWRRNIKKAAKAGVEVARVNPEGLPAPADLEAFHALYVHTAERDHFTPRPISYFRVMAESLAAEDPDRFQLWTARHEGDLVAATIAIRVGDHAWYSYGASSTEKRDVRGSNAVQWAMIRDAIEHDCAVYDMRGITDTLAADDAHVGLIQFKVGTGGEAVEYVGEWDLPINRALYAAFDLYMKKRR